MQTAGSEYTDAEIRKRLAYSEIAGGRAYVDNLADDEIPTREGADYVITADDTASDFFSATKKANNVPGGGLIWVDGDAEIDFSGSSGYISNCTVASDRGQGGSKGALLYTSDHGKSSNAYSGGSGTGLLTLQDNTRLFGIRLRGASYNYWDNSEHPGYIPLSVDLNPWLSRGLTINRSSVEVDNCEIFGWSTQGIVVEANDEGRAPEPEIHRSDIHNCMQTSYGYGLEAIRGHPYIHHMYFNATRHTLATFGFWDAGFVLEDSIIGPSTALFLLDSHNLGENNSGSTTDHTKKDFYGRAGGNIEIRRVTFCPTHVISDADYAAGDRTSHISFGGQQWPVDGDEPGTLVERCQMAHESPEDAIYQRTSGTADDGTEWSFPTGDNGFAENFVRRNNQYGAPKAPNKPGVGAPLNLDGPVPPTGVGGDLTREELRVIEASLRTVQGDLSEVRSIIANV